ncbi:MAG: phage tail protein [Proteobacteria bacterium]|nr:phage tail protein [Pseudomonadota bacterium]MBU1057982.1 phage tail protein [Pseudomonadota bacterium]
MGITELFTKGLYWLSALRLTFASLANMKHVAFSLRDGINPFGRVHFLIRNIRTGQITCDAWHPNLVVASGKNHIADQLSGRQEAQMSHMAIGTGTTTPLDANTALQTELDRNALDSRTQGTGADANKVTYTCTWAAGDGTGAITESGIFNSASAGQMLCRSVFPVKNKEAGESMVMTWILTISA